MKERSISFRRLPTTRQSRNPLESKHGVIRSTFLKLRNAEPNAESELHACRTVDPSSDLYGSNVVSSFELTKGYTKPAKVGSVQASPDDVVEAHEKLQTKRKLALILKLKSTRDVRMATGDIVEVFSKTGTEIFGTWRIVLGMDAEVRTV